VRCLRDNGASRSKAYVRQAESALAVSGRVARSSAGRPARSRRGRHIRSRSVDARWLDRDLVVERDVDRIGDAIEMTEERRQRDRVQQVFVIQTGGVCARAVIGG
jgi:hypothetical protein